MCHVIGLTNVCIINLMSSPSSLIFNSLTKIFGLNIRYLLCNPPFGLYTDKFDKSNFFLFARSLIKEIPNLL